MFDNLKINEIFTERNVPAIIMYLYLFGPKTRTEIYDNISKNPRMPIKLDKLIESKVITTIPGRSQKWPVLKLTETGMQFGRMLCTMEDLAGGNACKSKWLGLKKTLEQFGYVETKED
jgi:hypothetical protein